LGKGIFRREHSHNENAKVIEPAKDGQLPKCNARYMTPQFFEGKISDGTELSLNTMDHVRATFYLRNCPYLKSLTAFLRKARKIDFIKDRDGTVRVGRAATYVAVSTLIRFSR
jgi:hypothetical protein